MTKYKPTYIYYNEVITKITNILYHYFLKVFEVLIRYHEAIKRLRKETLKITYWIIMNKNTLHLKTATCKARNLKDNQINCL